MALDPSSLAPRSQPIGDTTATLRLNYAQKSFIVFYLPFFSCVMAEMLEKAKHKSYDSAKFSSNSAFHVTQLREGFNEIIP